MTRPATSEIKAYVLELRNQMRLQAWDLDISETRPDENTWAEVTPNDQRWHAVMKFSDEMFDELAEDQRDYFAHELLHLTQIHAWKPIAEGEWRHTIGQPLYNHLSGELRRGLELMVDHISHLVGRSLPLPPWATTVLPAAQDADAKPTTL